MDKELVSEPKYQILKEDYIDFRHPKSKRDRIVRLYRIISLREMFIPGFGHINKHEIGGYIENESNLSHDGNCWVTHSAKVFDKASVNENSLIKDDAAAYGECVIDGSSVLKNHSHVYGNATVTSSIISDKCDVYGDARIINSTLRNGSKVFGNAEIHNTSMYEGAFVHDDAKLFGCVMRDVSQARGNIIAHKCKFSGRAIGEEGQHVSETLHKDITLNIISGK